MKPVTDPISRKMILATGKLAQSQANITGASSPNGIVETDGQPLTAGQDFMLECNTPDLGRPLANIWLWYKDGQIIESSSYPDQDQQHQYLSHEANTDTNGRLPNISTLVNIDDESRTSLINENQPTRQDNSIRDRRHGTTLANSMSQNNLVTSRDGRQTSTPFGSNSFENLDAEEAPLSAIKSLDYHKTKTKLFASGRYLYIQAIRLNHRGNYSCVAVNRLGSGLEQAPSSMDQTKNNIQIPNTAFGHDSYSLTIAMAPSFVIPLPTRTYWSEAQSTVILDKVNSHEDKKSTNSSENRLMQLELTCHIQCEPICHIEWLRNNEHIDPDQKADTFMSYQVQNTIINENVDLNMFRSIESKLVIQIHQTAASIGSSQNVQDIQAANKILIDRDKLLERRHHLNNSNFTCQSKTTTAGPSVRSTTQFVVQCKYKFAIIYCTALIASSD